MAPLVSVIVPTYNGAPFIAETIDSILAQTHRSREIIVVDDGSTDETATRLGRYGSAIRYIWQENRGPGAARNRGLQEARGDYVAFLDHDDLWTPDTLEVQLDVAARHPASGMIVCDGVMFEGEQIVDPRLQHGPLARRLETEPSGELTGHFYRDFVRVLPVGCPGQMLIPAHVAKRIGPWITARDVSEDLDYDLRIALRYAVTLHRRSLTRCRYLATSRSGERRYRAAVYAQRDMPVLKRQIRLCPSSERQFVLQAIRNRQRESAWDAYYEGRRYDARRARRRLLRLLPAVRTAPLALLLLALLCLSDRALMFMRRFAKRAGWDSERIREIYRRGSALTIGGMWLNQTSEWWQLFS